MKKIITIVICSSFITAMTYCSEKQNKSAADRAIQEDRNEIKEDVKQLGRDLDKKSDEVRNEFKEDVREVKQDIKETNEEAKADAREFKEDVKRDVEDVKENHRSRQ